MQRIVISLGGSLIVPDRIDTALLGSFRTLILEYVGKGQSFCVVAGGGRTAREYQEATEKIGSASPEDRDWIGIMATRLNAELLRTVFSEHAHPKVITDPEELIGADAPIIIGAGHVPGSSSDLVAVRLAKALGAERLLNISNIDMVYDRDPKTDPSASPMQSISWEAFLQLIGTRWVPGRNVPFDPVAGSLAHQHKLEVIILGKDMQNLRCCLDRRAFVGTTIG